MSDGEESVKKITVTVKTPKEKQTVEVVENATISEVSTYYYNKYTYVLLMIIGIRAQSVIFP